MTSDSGGASKKSKIAFNKLKTMESDVTEIIGCLERISSDYITMLGLDNTVGALLSEDKLKDRGMLKYRISPDLPERIIFTHATLSLFIDFTVSPHTENADNSIKGNIVYGTLRKKRPSECVFEGTQTDERKCTNEDKEKRTAKIEEYDEKPLLLLNVYRNKLLQAENPSTGEWLIQESSDLHEPHNLAVKEIWMDALEWTNEKVLP